MAPQVFRRHWQLIVALLVLLGACGWALAAGLAASQGHLAYALDDPYIHMAVARNLVEYGVWGVTRYDFSASCSSLLWPLLLAVGYVIQVNDWLPLALNFACAVLTLGLAHRVLARFDATGRPGLRALALVALVVATPMVALVMIGMEHQLQVLVVLAFAAAAATAIAEPKAGEQLTAIALVALSGLMTAVRYEGLFLVALVGLLLMLRGRWRLALAMGAAGAAPVVAFGLYSVWQGSYFLPNSLMVKGNSPLFYSWERLVRFVGKFVHNITMAPEAFALAVGAGALWLARARARAWWEAGQTWLLLAAAGGIAHLMLAGTGFYRYEAYTIALGLVAVAAAILADGWPRGLARRLGLAVLAVAVAVPLGVRTVHAQTRVPVSMGNIYEQQVQMSRFLARHYAGRGVVANDIGAINFFADIRCLDLVGLGNVDIVRLNRAGAFNTEAIDRLSREQQAAVAVVYDHWFLGPAALPASWVKVGDWTIGPTVAVGGRTVSFYATGEAEREPLTRALKAFSGELPPTVRQSGVYTVGAEDPDGKGR